MKEQFYTLPLEITQNFTCCFTKDINKLTIQFIEELKKLQSNYDDVELAFRINEKKIHYLCDRCFGNFQSILFKHLESESATNF